LFERVQPSSPDPFFPSPHSYCNPSNNHLRHPLPTQRLTAHKLLLLQPRERVEHRRNQQHHRRHNQTAAAAEYAEPLDQAHAAVDGGPHVVGGEAADEGVKGGGGGADAQKEGDLDED
jgi:hypothetical protein